MNKGSFSKLVCSLLWLYSTIGYSFTFDPEINFSGFASSGVSVTNATNVDFVDPIFKQKISTVPIIVGIDNNPVFEQDTVGGLQFVFSVNDHLSFSGQFVSEGFRGYTLGTDWLFVGWKANDNWDVQVGRIIVPLLMHYPYLKVNYAYPWSRLPLEVYSLGISDFEGILVRNNMPLKGGWKSQFTTTFGTSTGENNFYATPLPFDETEGIFFEWNIYNDAMRFRLGFDRLTLALSPNLDAYKAAISDPCATFGTSLSPAEITIVNGPVIGTCQITDINSPLPFSASQGLIIPDFDTAKLLTMKNVKTELYTLGYEGRWENIILMGEYFRVFLSDKYGSALQSWYVLLGYNWDNFTPHITYSSIITTNDASRVLSNTPGQNYINPFSYFGPLPIPQPQSFQDSINEFFRLNDNHQSTIDVGLRYDLGYSIAFKFDYRYVMPQNNTRGFFSVPPQKRISWLTAVVAIVF